MTHLTSDEIVDAVEGVLDGADAHLDSCTPCRNEVDRLSQR